MSSLSISAQAPQPYPGLRPFLLEEADIFFGREEQVRQLLERLNRGRFLALVGISGCGKSSLARAGLTAALEAGFMVKAGARWRVVTMRPDTQPLNNLADALLQPGVLGSDESSASAADHDVKPFLLAMLRRGPSGLAEFLSEPLTASAGPALPASENLLLLVDQFEEIFRFWREGNRNEADAFVSLLIATARQENLPVYVVLTMRSDYLGDCAVFHGLPEALNDNQFLTPRLTWQQRRKAIEGPARVFGGQVEPALVGRLLNDMGPEPDQLPLMQHVLMRLWSRARLAAAMRPDTAGKEVVLRLEEYERLGKLKDALDQHAEEIYEKALSAEQRPLAEVLFRCLSERDVSGGMGGSRDTRRPARLQDIAAVAGVPCEQVAAVADVFRQAGVNFLMPTAEVPLTKETVLDITHESLLRQWKRLRGWVEAEAKSTNTYRRLESDAREWVAGRADLMDGLNLKNTLEWLQRERPTSAWSRRYGNDFALVQRFLGKSEQAEKVHAAERKRQKRQKRVVRVVIGVLVLAIVVLSLVAIVLHWQDVAAGEAKLQQAKLETQQKIATTEKLNAEYYSLTRIAESSMQLHPITSVFCGAEAEKMVLKHHFSVEKKLIAQELFQKSLSNIGGRGYGAGQGLITNIAVSEDDSTKKLRWMASSDLDGTILLWDKTDQPGGWPLRLIGYQANIQQLQFTRKTGWLIAQSQSGLKFLVTFWKLNDPNRSCKVADGYQHLYVSRDKNWLLTYDAGRARLFDLRNADPTTKPVELKSDSKSFNIRFISFTYANINKGNIDKGDWLAVISKEGDVYLCDLKTGKERGEKNAVMLKVTDTPDKKVPKNREAKNGEFTDNSDQLIVYFSDGSVRVWKRGAGRWEEPGTEKRLETPFKKGDPVQVVTDLRGLRVVIARKSALASSVPTPSVLTAPSAVVSTTDDQSDAYFFDGNDLNKRITLRGFDDSLDWSKYIQVDEQMGRLAAVCRRPEDGIRIWDLRSVNPKIPPTPAKSPASVLSWMLAPKGRWLVTRGPENFVRLWDLLSTGPIPTPAILRGHDGTATVFAFSEENRWLVTGGQDGTLRAWDMKAVSPSAEPVTLHNAGAPHTVLISPNKQWFAIADIGTVRFWGIAKYDRSVQLHPRDVPGNRFPILRASEDGRWLFGIYQKEKDFEAILWDTQAEGEPSEYCRLGNVQGEITALHVSPDGWVATTVVKNRLVSVRLWRLSEGQGNPGGKVAQPVPWNPEGSAWGFAAGGNALLTYTGGSFLLWKLGDSIGKNPFLKLEQGSFQTARLTPNGNFLLVKVGLAPANLIDLNALVTGKTPAEKKLAGWPGFGPTMTYISGNSRWLFAVSSSKDFLCWDLKSPKSNLAAVEYRPKKQGDKPDYPTLPAVEQQFGYSLNEKKMFVLSSDRHWLVTHDGIECHLWDLASESKKALDIAEEQVRPQRWPLASQISNAVFSPNSSWLLTAAGDEIHLFSLNTVAKRANPVKAPKYLLPAKFYPGRIRVAAVSREERWLAVTADDPTIRIGDLAEGVDAQPVILTSGVGLYPTGLFISPKEVFSIDESSSTIQISSVSAKGLLEVAESVVGRNPTQAEWEKLGVPGDYRRVFPSLPIPKLEPDLDAPSQSDAQSGAVAELLLRDGTAQVHGQLTKNDPKDAKRTACSCKVYTVQLHRGKVYQIDLRSKAFDAFLRLETADLTELAYDDDGGGGLNARIVFRCPENATYRIIATSFDQGLGNFTLTVQSGTRLDPFGVVDALPSKEWQERKRKLDQPSSRPNVQPRLPDGSSTPAIPPGFPWIDLLVFGVFLIALACRARWLARSARQGTGFSRNSYLDTLPTQLARSSQAAMKPDPDVPGQPDEQRNAVGMSGRRASP